MIIFSSLSHPLTGPHGLVWTSNQRLGPKLVSKVAHSLKLANCATLQRHIGSQRQASIREPGRTQWSTNLSIHVCILQLFSISQSNSRSLTR